MPIGIIVNISAVISGGLIGSFTGNKLSDYYKKVLPKLTGFCAMAIGILKVSQAENLNVIIISFLSGAIIGEIIDIEKYLEKGAKKLLKLSNKSDLANEPEKNEWLVLAFVLFVFSGLGFFGAMSEAFTGQSMILLSKSVMDFVMAYIIGSIVGYSLCFVSIPQALVLSTFYLLGSLLMPMISESLINNFLSVGGIMTIVISLKIVGAIDIKAANLIPALVMVFLVSYLAYLF